MDDCKPKRCGRYYKKIQDLLTSSKHFYDRRQMIVNVFKNEIFPMVLIDSSEDEELSEDEDKSDDRQPTIDEEKLDIATGGEVMPELEKEEDTEKRQAIVKPLEFKKKNVKKRQERAKEKKNN